MNKILRNFTFLILSLVAFTSCEMESDLYVENPESPNDKTLLSDPVALEATAQGLFRSWYMANSNYYGPGMALNTMADVSSCSWGNAGMKDLSSEPRAAFNNTSSYGNNVTRGLFNAMYAVINDSNNIQKALGNGVFDTNPNKAVINAVSKFTQALGMGYNALYFKRVWLSDETGVIDGSTGVLTVLDKTPAATYSQAMTFALTKLDAAIAAAASVSTIPSPYFNGSISSGAELARVMSSYGARMVANNARTKAERTAVDWTKVKAYAAGGVTSDYNQNHDDIIWYDYFKTYLVYPGWARIDMRVINMMDSNTDAYWDASKTIYPKSTSTDPRLASDFAYLSGQNFRPERGTYHYSSYRYGRYDSYISEWTIPTVEIPKSENDMYHAEALWQAGDYAGAAVVINAGTRVTRGTLAPVAATEAAVKAAIHYERMVEFPLASSGISFWEMRGKDLLQAGTLLHFPIPGSALESIPEAYYTFGGTQGVSGTDYSAGGWR